MLRVHSYRIISSLILMAKYCITILGTCAAGTANASGKRQLNWARLLTKVRLRAEGNERKLGRSITKNGERERERDQERAFAVLNCVRATLKRVGLPVTIFPIPFSWQRIQGKTPKCCLGHVKPKLIFAWLSVRVQVYVRACVCVWVCVCAWVWVRVRVRVCPACLV